MRNQQHAEKAAQHAGNHAAARALVAQQRPGANEREERDRPAQHAGHARQKQPRALRECVVIDGGRQHGHHDEVKRMPQMTPLERSRGQRERENRNEAEQHAQKHDLGR
jgi:hypothetical protein